MNDDPMTDEQYLILKIFKFYDFDNLPNDEFSKS